MAQHNKGVQVTRLKGGKMRTPVGTARWAYVNRPDDSTYGKGQYRLTIVFDKTDPEFKVFYQKLVALSKLHAAEIGQTGKGTIPIKLVDEKMANGKDGKGGTGDPIGAPYIAVETASVGKDGSPKSVPIFNAQAKEDAGIQVYAGDIVRAEISVAGWLLKGDFGVKGYLNAVQQLKSNWQGGAGSSFEAESEYVTDEESTDSLTEEVDADVEEAPFEDESPTTEAPEAEAGDDLDDLFA